MIFSSEQKQAAADREDFRINVFQVSPSLRDLFRLPTLRRAPSILIFILPPHSTPVQLRISIPV